MILVVEPDGDLRSTMVRVLQRGGFDVESAADVQAAAARMSQGACRLVVASVDAADVAAANLLQAACRQTPRIPVILTSARASVAAAVAAMREGACDYLIKPFSAETLEAAVRNGAAASEPSPAAVRAAGMRSLQKTFITNDPCLLEVLQMARQVARSSATVLIQGESGTGKELLAAFIHRHGLHPEAPYVAVNCAALPEHLAESELFGHEKGAFTGAVTRKAGKFELAQKGTLVLDEIGEMPLPLQAKLLRALQERAIDRVGGALPVPVPSVRTSTSGSMWCRW